MVKTFFSIESYGASDIGLVREQNEDAWGAWPELGLYLLADGMGGHNAGEVAAQMAVSTLHQRVEMGGGSDLEAFSAQSLEEVNRQIYEAGCAHAPWSGMGTTLTALLFSKKNVVVTHVGDSRAYRLRGAEFKQLTVDHTASRPSPDGKGERRVLTRALGTQPCVLPQIQSFSVHLADRYLLCSDGLLHYLADRELKEGILREASIEERALDLIEKAKERGGCDNITVLLIEVAP